MREIKFKALELDTGNVVYGYYVAEHGYYMCNDIPDLNKPVVRHYIIGDGGKHDVLETSVRQFTGVIGKGGVEIYDGDTLRYADLYECHSDAVDYYGVEPQNNFPVSEVYPEYKEGVVEFSRSAYTVDGIDISELGNILVNKINDCYWMGNFGCPVRDFIALCHDCGFPSPIRRSYPPEVVGDK